MLTTHYSWLTWFAYLAAAFIGQASWHFVKGFVRRIRKRKREREFQEAWGWTKVSILPDEDDIR